MRLWVHLLLLNIYNSYWLNWNFKPSTEVVNTKTAWVIRIVYIDALDDVQACNLFCSPQWTQFTLAVQQWKGHQLDKSKHLFIKWACAERLRKANQRTREWGHLLNSLFSDWGWKIKRVKYYSLAYFYNFIEQPAAPIIGARLQLSPYAYDIDIVLIVVSYNQQT